MNPKPKYGLSRRKVLAGLGTVGLASAGAGLGTSAYFNDEESFENNRLQAGTLDLVVDWHASWDQGIAGDGARSGTVGRTDDPVVSGVLTDVKPGDSGKLAFCFTLDDNPGYLWTCGAVTADAENGQPEPEENHVDAPDDDGSDGELDEKVEVALSYCNRVEQGQYVPTAEVVTGTFRDVMDVLAAGLPLDGDATPGVGGPDAVPFDGGVETDNPCLCLDWVLPADVGNEVQSDSLTFDLAFHAVQARHNDENANPCADESYAADYINDEHNANQFDGVMRMDVAYADDEVFYRVQLDDDESGDKLSDPSFAATNVAVGFDVDEDDIADFQVAWNPGESFPNDPFAYSGVNGTPAWEKDVGSWASLPTGFRAAKVGEFVVVVVPRSAFDANDGYKFGAFASAGGEAPYAAISNQAGMFWSADDSYTSAEYYLQSSLPAP